MQQKHSFNFIMIRSAKRASRMAGAAALSLPVCAWHTAKRTRNGVVREEVIF